MLLLGGSNVLCCTVTGVLTLLLDVVSSSPLLALHREVGEGRLHPLSHPSREEILLEEIRATLKGMGGDLRDLHRLICVTGPGGAVSLRVGIALANALSHALHITLLGQTQLDLVRHRLSPGVSLLWVHSLNRERLLVARLGGETSIPVRVGTLTPAALLVRLDQWGRDYVGELSLAHRRILPLRPCFEHLRSLLSIIPSLVAQSSFSLTPLLPWYGRGPL